MRSIRVLSTVAVLMLVASVGAEQRVEYGVAQSSSTWATKPSGEQRVPGIHEASVLFLTLKSGNPTGVPLILWSDANRGFQGRGEGSAEGAHFRGEQQLKDGSLIEIEAETTDGETGFVHIAGKRFELEDGPLFLISTRAADPPEILQLPLDRSKFSKVRGGHEKLMKLASENEKIADFWKKERTASAD